MTDWLAYLIVCPLTMLAGLIDSVAGGGGLISLPAYLAAGLPPHLAAGSNKLSACIGSLAANLAYIKSKAVPWRTALFGVLGALPGAAIGTRLLLIISGDIIRPMLLIAVPVVAWLVFRAKSQEAPPLSGWRASRWAGAVIPLAAGLVIGMYDGFFGPGTGTFLALALRGALHLSWLRATAAAKMINLASNAASLVVFLFSGQVAVALALTASVFSVAGNLIGARLAMKKGGKAIRVMLIVALALLLARVAWDLLFPAV